MDKSAMREELKKYRKLTEMFKEKCEEGTITIDIVKALNRRAFECLITEMFSSTSHAFVNKEKGFNQSKHNIDKLKEKKNNGNISDKGYENGIKSIKSSIQNTSNQNVANSMNGENNNTKGVIK